MPLLLNKCPKQFSLYNIHLGRGDFLMIHVLLLKPFSLWQGAGRVHNLCSNRRTTVCVLLPKIANMQACDALRRCRTHCHMTEYNSGFRFPPYYRIKGGHCAAGLRHSSGFMWDAGRARGHGRQASERTLITPRSQHFEWKKEK